MKIFNLILSALFVIALSGCGGDDEPSLTASVNLTSNTSGDIGGDVIGNGGSHTQTYTYTNQMPTADYNMDITAAVGGEFNLVVSDADGTELLNKTLIKGQGDDSFSGVTAAGTAGTWTVNVTLTNFNGDGSFSLSEGN